MNTIPRMVNDSSTSKKRATMSALTNNNPPFIVPRWPYRMPERMVPIPRRRK
jgi:hypothetical protein